MRCNMYTHDLRSRHAAVPVTKLEEHSRTVLETRIRVASLMLLGQPRSDTGLGHHLQWSDMHACFRLNIDTDTQKL